MSDILTPAQTCGPLFGFALFPEGLNQAVDPQAPNAITIEGSLLDGAGESVGYGSFIEFWSEGQAVRARTLDGRYQVTLARPAAQTIAGAGTLAPSLNVTIYTRGLARSLVTRLYFPDEAQANAADPVLASVPAEFRARLIARPGTQPNRLVYDIHLQGPQESVFFALQAPTA